MVLPKRDLVDSDEVYFSFVKCGSSGVKDSKSFASHLNVDFTKQKVWKYAVNHITLPKSHENLGQVTKCMSVETVEKLAIKSNSWAYLPHFI